MFAFWQGTVLLYRRQKIILKLLGILPYYPTKTELTKIVFLLRNETVLRDADSFYSFLPYQYGPFSFTLTSEIEALREKGLLEFDDHKIIITQLGQQINDTAALTPKEIKSASTIAHKYSNKRGNNLLKLVYNKYPWYATRSKVNPNYRVSIEADESIFTIGYEGKSIDLFLDTLLHKGVKQLIDVRSNTVSRKSGFSKDELNSYCGKVDISYLSFPSLGIPSALRKNLKTESDYRQILKKYKDTWLPEVKGVLEQVKDEMTSAPSALMCFEKDPKMCHRSVVASVCSRRTGRPITHM